MKNKKQDAQKHGVISVVQSPDEAENTLPNPNKSNTEKVLSAQEEHGIISVIQSPDEKNNRKND